MCRITPTQTKTLDKKPIPCDHGFRLASLSVDGGDATTLLCLIVDVVMHERSRVNELKGQGERHNVRFVLTACKVIRQKEQNRTEAFATGVEDTPCFMSHLASTCIDFVLNQVVEGSVDLFTHGFQCRLKHLKTAAHALPTTVGFLTGRPRP